MTLEAWNKIFVKIESTRVSGFMLSSRHPVLCRRITGPLVRSPTSGSRGSRSSTFSSTSLEEKGGKRGRKRGAVLRCVWIALRGTRTCPMHALHPVYRTNLSRVSLSIVKCDPQKIFIKIVCELRCAKYACPLMIESNLLLKFISTSYFYFFFKLVSTSEFHVIILRDASWKQLNLLLITSIFIKIYQFLKKKSNKRTV